MATCSFRVRSIKIQSSWVEAENVSQLPNPFSLTSVLPKVSCHRIGNIGFRFVRRVSLSMSVTKATWPRNNVPRRCLPMKTNFEVGRQSLAVNFHVYLPEAIGRRVLERLVDRFVIFSIKHLEFCIPPLLPSL